MSSWTLHSHGRLPWTQARETLADYTCVWLDLDGLHVGAPPRETPIATHIWGWSNGHYARARLDTDAAYLGVLHETPPPSAAGEPVTVHPRAAVMRSAATGETAPQEFNELAVELLEIPGPHPVTFVRARQRT